MAGNTGRIGGQYGNKNSEKYNEEFCIDIGKRLIDWINEPPKITKTEHGNTISDINLFIIEFISKQGLTKDFINEQSQKFPSFREIIKEAKTIQEAKILKYSMINKFNPTMSIFCLKNHHGYKDKQEIDQNTQVTINIDGEDKNL